MNLGVEIIQTSTSTEQKSRTLPVQSSTSSVEQSSSQQTTSGKKKSGGFFSMKKKWIENDFQFYQMQIFLFS